MIIAGSLLLIVLVLSSDLNLFGPQGFQFITEGTKMSDAWIFRINFPEKESGLISSMGVQN